MHCLTVKSIEYTEKISVESFNKTTKILDKTLKHLMS